MGSRFFQRPENAISKAEEFIGVGKPTKALDTLYDVIKSKKRYHNYPEKLIEQIMLKYLELCVDLKKSHIAKEGLFQYRNLCQMTNVASLASVVQRYLTMAEQRTEAARQESAESAAEVDDLENLNTPEMIMLSAVSGEDAHDRTDRTILMPWVKFLWESYCQCLELLRTNTRVERLYHDIAQQAFRFCLKYQRKAEFRKLCEKLRIHLELVMKQVPSQSSIDLNNADTQQMNLETRLAQLEAAIQIELWQEAYKAVEDVHGLMTLSKKVFQPKVMSNYYQKLALVFWKSGNRLFHAAAVFKHFQLARDMKKSINTEELGKLASRVLAACLAVPIPSHHPEFDKFIETDRTPQEKMARLALLLSLQQPPTRQTLLKDAVRFGIVQVATQPLQDLYHWLEVEFHPLKLCGRVQKTLKLVEESDDKSNLQQYLSPLRDITLVRLLKQVSQVYQSICFNRLISLAPFATSFEMERIIVNCVRHNDMQVRLDHRTRTVHFGKELVDSQSISEAEGPHLQDMPSEQIRTQLMLMLEVLEKSVKTIHPDKIKSDNDSWRQKIVHAYQGSKAREHQRILERQKRIEERKVYLEEMSINRVREEERKHELELREKLKKEKERLEAEREEKEKQKNKDKLMEIHKQHMKDKVNQIAQTELGKRVLDKMGEKEIAELDTDQIMMKQVEELENEKRMLVARLKNQEKKMDHMERAKRKEELPLLQEAMRKDLEEDKMLWDAKEENRIKDAGMKREEAVKHRDRLCRMKEDKDAFMSTLLKQRKTVFEKKLKEYNQMIERERKIRLEERKQQRKDERRRKYIKEREEEKQRKKDEEMKRLREEKAREEEERRAKEEEEYRKKREALDLIAAKQKEREREIEEKLQRGREEKLAAARSSRTDDVSDWRRVNRDGGEDRGRDPEEKGRGEPGTGGGWREREKKKDEEWGPRHDRDSRPPYKEGEEKETSRRDLGGPRRDGEDRDGARPEMEGSWRTSRDDGPRGIRRFGDREDRGGPRMAEKETWRRDDRRDFRREDDRRDDRRDFRREDDRRDFRREDDRRDDRRDFRRDDDRRDDWRLAPRRIERSEPRRDDRGGLRDRTWGMREERGGGTDRDWRSAADDRGPRRDDHSDKPPQPREGGEGWKTATKR